MKGFERRATTRAAAVLILVGAGLLTGEVNAASSAEAEWSEVLPVQSVSVLQVDARGNAAPWEAQVVPVWENGTPRLRLWLEFPGDLKKVEVFNSAADPALPGNGPGYDVIDQPKGSPYLKARMRWRWIFSGPAISLRSRCA